jgi:lactoylglutathione lyase
MYHYDDTRNFYFDYHTIYSNKPKFDLAHVRDDSISKNKGEQMKTKFDMIGIFVNDLKTMVDFYKNVVGLPTDWDGNPPYAEFKHEGIRFSMYERNKLPELLGQEPSFPKGINGTFELAINVGKPENVDDTFDRFVKSGAKPIYTPRDEPWKMRSSMIADPEGNLIEIGSDFWE